MTEEEKTTTEEPEVVKLKDAPQEVQDLAVSKAREVFHKLPVTAKGDLTVSKTPPAEFDKKTGLPQVGTRFMIEGNSFKVVYVNEGKKRFSASPVDGQY